MMTDTVQESVDRAVVIEETEKEEVDLLRKFICTGRTSLPANHYGHVDEIRI